MTPQETDPDLPVSVQGSLAEAWVGGGLLQVWGTECSSACVGPFEGGRHYLHYLHQFWSQVKQQGGNTTLPSTENWIKDLLSMALPIRTRLSFPLSHLSHQQDSISLLSFSIRGLTD